MKKYDGKVVVVTGGANGIGQGIARKFAQEGAYLAILDIDSRHGEKNAKILSDRFQKALFIETDVSNYDQIIQAQRIITKTFGRVDVLVLNAGVAGSTGLNELSLEEWHRTIAINLDSAFYAVKAFHLQLIEYQGAMIFISSGSAATGTGGSIAYPASKAGCEGLMRGTAKALSRFGVRVNAIAPRVIESNLLDVNYPTASAKAMLKKKIPIGRFGTIQDCANLAYFLADPDNGYICGQTITLDGGRGLN